MTLPAASKHLRVLERAGLVNRRIDGRVHRCSLDSRQLYRRMDIGTAKPSAEERMAARMALADLPLKRLCRWLLPCRACQAQDSKQCGDRSSLPCSIRGRTMSSAVSFCSLVSRA